MNLLILLLLTGVPPTQRGSLESKLSREATRLYGKKDFVHACPLYAQIAELRKKDGAAWADLGLCLLKLRRGPEADVANARALFLGSAAVRKSVYFNLQENGVSLVPDEGDEPELCTKLPTTPDCAIPVWKYHGSEEGKGLGYKWGAAKGTLGLTCAEAQTNERPLSIDGADEADPTNAPTFLESAEGQLICWPGKADFTCRENIGYRISCRLVWVDGCHRRAATCCDRAESQDQLRLRRSANQTRCAEFDF